LLIDKERHNLISEEKNNVLRLISDDFTYTDVAKYVETSSVHYAF